MAEGYTNPLLGPEDDGEDNFAPQPGWGALQDRMRPGARAGTVQHGGREYYEFEYQPGDPGHPSQEGQAWTCTDCGAEQKPETPAVMRGRPLSPPVGFNVHTAGHLCRGCMDKPPDLNTWRDAAGRVVDKGQVTPEAERWDPSKPLSAETGPYRGEHEQQPPKELEPYTGEDEGESPSYTNPLR